MKNVVKVLLFMIYTISIFLIKRDEFTVIVLCVNFLLTIILKISIKEEVSNILGIIILILFTAIINSIFVDMGTGVRIGIKLILVCNITFIFSKIMNYTELADALERIFSIFKVLKINSKNISLMICICISFIPTIKKQMKQVKDALIAKGVKLNLRNSNLVFEPIVISLLKRVDEIESSLKAKAYEEQ